MATNSTQSWQEHIATIQAGIDRDGINTAIRALQPLIEERAERVCCLKVKKQIGRDFICDSVAYVLTDKREKGKNVGKPRIADYDLQKGRFPAWLKTVLENRLKDVLESTGRRAAREQTVVDRVGEPGFFESHPDSEAQPQIDELDRPFQFSDRNIERIANWKVLDRILMIVINDLWPKIPTEVWRDWCSEAGLPASFPENGADAIDSDEGRSQSGWFSLIANLIGGSRDALKVRYHRRLEKLKHEDHEFTRSISHGE